MIHARIIIPFSLLERFWAQKLNQFMVATLSEHSVYPTVRSYQRLHGLLADNKS